MKGFKRLLTLPVKVGSLAALHLGKRGHKIDLYEYREGKNTCFNFNQIQL